MICFKTFYVFEFLLLAVGADANSTYHALLPDIVYAIRGSCALIPCTFNISDFEAKLNNSSSIHAVWIKGKSQFSDNPVVFNGTDNTTKLLERIEILGNLRQRDCTTVFYNVNQSHTDKYFFRTEMTHFRATFLEKPFNLTVNDSLGPPRVSELSDVSEGTSVNLTCTAAAPCPSQPPNITWSLHIGNTHTLIQDEKHGNRSLISILTFTATRSHHGREIYCKASYPSQNRSNTEENSTARIISILFSPAVVVSSVNPTGPLAEGSSVTLTCNSSEANPPVQNYTWFRRDQNATIRSGQILTFNLSSSNEGLYYCRAKHPEGGRDSDDVRLMIIKEKQKTWFVPIIGATAGSLVFLVVVICVMRWYKSRLPQGDEHNSQCEITATCERPAHTNGPKPSEGQLEMAIHYGEIKFSKEPLGETTQEQAPRQETEYAEVHLSGKNAPTHD